MKKRLAIILGLLLLTGCSGETDSDSPPTELVVSDVPGTQTAEEFPLKVFGVEIKAEAKRVVSLSPAVTEIIAELGYADRLCGISVYCDYPQGLSAVTVGSAENPDIAAITELAPDLLITLTQLPERDLYALEQAGITAVCADTPDTLEEFAGLYGGIESCFSGAEKGAESGERAADSLKKASEGVQLGSFIYLTGKLTAAGSGTFPNAVLSLCGENLCVGEGYCAPETLEGVQPEYIIAGGELSGSDISGNEALSAMLGGGARIIYVNGAWFERPTSRTAEVFAQIQEQLSGESQTDE